MGLGCRSVGISRESEDGDAGGEGRGDGPNGVASGRRRLPMYVNMCEESSNMYRAI